METCPICKGPHAKNVGRGLFPGAEVECSRCGSYRVTDSALSARVSKLSNPERVFASGWIREQNEMGSSPRILDNDVERILQLRKPTLKERAERILSYFIRQSSHLNADFEISSPALCAIAYVTDLDELRIVLRYLSDNRLIEFSRGPSIRCG
jgi:hypothetical protein